MTQNVFDNVLVSAHCQLDTGPSKLNLYSTCIEFGLLTILTVQDYDCGSLFWIFQNQACTKEISI